MKTINKIGIAALAIFAMACTNDDDSLATSGRVAVNFSTNINLTRAMDNTWEDSDRVGIYMLQSGSSEVAGQAANKQYQPSVSDNSLSPVGAENIIYFPEDGSAVNFLAYSPYRELAQMSYPIDVADQSKQNAIDFLYAAKTGNKTQTDPNVAFVFEHKLSKLILQVSSSSNADLSALSVKIHGMNTSATYDLATGALGNASKPQAIDMFRNNNQFEAILLPATLTDACYVEFTLGNETFIWKISTTIPTLVGGNKYIYQVTLTPEVPILTQAGVSGTISNWISTEGDVSLTPDAALQYKIGDYYPDPKVDVTNPEAVAKVEGVVFEVSADGKHGKMLSMTEKSGLLWSTTGAKDDTLDQNDGMVNLNILKAKDAALTDYPAFAWCVSLGEGWYIPALNELLAVRTSWGATNVEKDAFNARITAINGEPIKASVFVASKGSNQSAYYYTSTEKADAPNKILSVSFNSTSGASDGLKKSSNSAENLMFRAVKAF